MKYKLCFLFIKVYTYNNFNNLITELLGRKNKVKFRIFFYNNFKISIFILRFNRIY